MIEHSVAEDSENNPSFFIARMTFEAKDLAVSAPPQQPNRNYDKVMVTVAKLLIYDNIIVTVTMRFMCASIYDLYNNL